MRQLTVLLAIAAVSAPLGAQPALGSSMRAGHAAASPTLQMISQQPFVVRGAAFQPAERVSVTALTLIGPRKTVVRASGAGVFRATLRLVGRPCGRAFAVRAVGELGSRAILQLRAAPCVPPPVR